MKLDKIFVTLFVGLAMTACSNDEEATTGGNQLPVDGKAAYMSLSLAMPKSSGTRAPGENHGTTDEQKVNELYLALFDASDICLETKTLSATDYILNVVLMLQDMMVGLSEYLLLLPRYWLLSTRVISSSLFV